MVTELLKLKVLIFLCSVTASENSSEGKHAAEKLDCASTDSISSSCSNNVQNHTFSPWTDLRITLHRTVLVNSKHYHPPGHLTKIFARGGQRFD